VISRNLLSIVAFFSPVLLASTAHADTPQSSHLENHPALTRSNLCGIFNPANLAGMRWVDDPDLARQFAAQSQTAIWHTLPSTIRCGRNSRLVNLTSSDGSRFLSYAFFKYPEGTIGVGSDMIYVALKARVANGRHSSRHAICAVNGADNKWFNSEPTHKNCVLTP
jgi:hypothetical protein